MGATIARLIGGAGTGKTTELMRLMGKAIEAGDIGPDQIGFVSFTRAARAEAASRAADKFGCKVEELEQAGWFRTLHSVCYKCLQASGDEIITDDKTSQKWIGDALQVPVEYGDGGSEEDGLGVVVGTPKSDAARALAIWHTARNRLISFETVWNERRRQDDSLPPLDRCRAWVERYELHKTLDHRRDFTDLLGQFSGWRFLFDGPVRSTPQGSVPELPVWFFDEQQDTSPLLDSVCHRLVSTDACRWVYVVGDPFQCQPAGTRVLTTQGEKAIEDLDPESDRLVCYDRNSGVVVGFSQGYRFVKAERQADWIVSLRVNGRTLRSTFNHKWLVKWTDKAPHRCCVYLMRKGDRWRVGWCQIFRKPDGGSNDGIFHLGTRARIEGADAAWILRVCEDRTEASVYESVIAATYGLPTITFKPVNGAKHLTDEAIDRVFSMLNRETLATNAERCLRDFCRDVQFPLWYANKQAGMTRVQVVQACNLLPGLMSIPKHLGGKAVEWQPIAELDRIYGRQQVYSLEVEKHHNYVADGFVTCNSIYGFAGADSKAFLSWPVAKEGIMPKSYRCPAPIHTLGEKILKPCSDYFDRGIAPADHEGMVRREIDLRSVVAKIDPRESWLLIARTNFQARRFANILNDEWIPWRPTTGYGGWQAPKRNLGMTAIMQLRDGWPIMPAEWKAALDLFPAKYAGEELLVRGTKSQWSKEGFTPSEELATLGTLHDWGATTRLKELIQHGGWSRIVEHGERYASAVRRFGTESLDNSGIRVGTIHCSPADEPVLTTAGYVPIADLDPTRHKLASYDARTNRMTWGGRSGIGKTRDDQGFLFRMACNPYRGPMLTLETEASRTRVTPTHRVRVKFAESFFNKWVVYLMRRGNWWRVGVCTSGRLPYISGGVGGRLATEKADAGWILGVYETRSAALIGEAVIQAKYGMPSLTFEAAKGRALSAIELHSIHSATEPFVAERARAMMRDLCLDENWPLYTRNGKVRLTTAFETIAANVLSDYMLLPVPRPEFATRESPEWLTVRVTSEPFDGPVYSLEVLPFRHYVSGGAVVHNSVKGAEADNVILLTTTSSMIAKSQETQSGSDEERRIGYVGITRARRQLVVVDELRERNKIEV